MRCAFCNIESIGHTVPTIAVARAFSSAGHDVCYLTPEGDLPANKLIHASGLEMGYLPRDGGDKHDAARQTIRAIQRILEKKDTQVLFTGALYFKGSIAAELRGIPDVRLFPNPYVQTEYNECPFADLGRSTIRDPHHQQWFEHVNVLRACYGLARQPASVILTSSFANILLIDASVPHLAVGEDDVLVAGPIIDLPSTPPAIRAPAGTPPCIFLSVGTEISTTKRGRAFLDRFIAKFREQTSPPFRLRAYVGLASRGSDQHQAQMGVVEIGGLVSQQLEIEEADVVVSHGGWNTVHEAIFLGKPQIVLPFEGHQHLTATWVSQQHLGVSMPPEAFDYATAVKTATALMRDGTVGQAVRQMAERFANPGNRGTFVRFIEERYARRCSSRLSSHEPRSGLSTPPAPPPAPSGPPNTECSRVEPACPVRLRITCGVATVEALDLVARNGVDEVFCGFQDPAVRSAFFRILNRREMPSANLTSVHDFDAFVQRGKELGLRVFVTLNEIFTATQWDYVNRFLEFLSTRSVDGLVISDFALLLFLSREYPGRFVIHMGTGALSLNARTAGHYLALGAKRIVLSRKMFTPEIARIRAALPDLETEAFMESHAYCPNCDGLCNILHNNAVCSSERCDVVELRYPFVIHNQIINWGCKLCAIWDYIRLGITCLKIPFRDRDPDEAVRLVGLIRNLEALAATKTKPEFVALVKDRFVGVFGGSCPNPTDCYLARSFSG